jgi:hypothetical protein
MPPPSWSAPSRPVTRGGGEDAPPLWPLSLERHSGHLSLGRRVSGCVQPAPRAADLAAAAAQSAERPQRSVRVETRPRPECRDATTDPDLTDF